MIFEIMQLELKNILQSKKFAVSFALVSLLLLLSVLLGIRSYTMQMHSYQTMQTLNEQEMREQKNWMGFSEKASRKPLPLQIFISGVSYDVGRYSTVSSHQPIQVSHGLYTDDPFFAMFRFLDFSFISVFVLSLFILVFTYDAVNGEAESGTLKLVFSNAVPRAVFLTGKALGIWCGVLLPLLIPMFLSLAIVLVSGVPLNMHDVLGILGIFCMVLLLGTFFVVLGIFLSVVIKRPSVSFLAALAAWILFTCIIPRAGILLAGQMVYVPGIQEIKGEQEQYEKQAWAGYMNKLQIKWKEREIPVAGLSAEERSAYRDKNMWAWMEEDEADRNTMQKAIEQHFRDLQENQKNNKRQLEKLALLFARISPVAAFQLTVMDISSSDAGMKDRFEDALDRFRTAFVTYKSAKEKESGNSGGFRVSFDSESGMKIDVGRTRGTLDISGVPRFDAAAITPADWSSSLPGNAALLLLMALLLFGGTFAAFLRFDVR